MTYQPKKRKRIIEYKKPDRKYSKIDGNVIEILNKYITYVFIPPNRNSAKFMWDEQTLLKQLIEAYLKNETSKRDTLSPKFVEAADYVNKHAFKRIAAITKKFYNLNQNIDYEIKFEDDISYKNFINNICFYVTEKNQRYDLSDCGSGIQSLTIIALHRAIANLQHNRIILGIEEPETNLHPQAQKELVGSIRDMIDEENSNMPSIILTTHSTVIIDQLGHEQIVLFRKEDDPKRGFVTTVKSVNKNFFSDNNIDEFRYYQFHNYRNSDFFFARYVIIVESKNESELIRYFAKQMGIDLDICGISLINLEGLRNIKYPLDIVKELSIPYLIIVDKDFFVPYLNDDLENSRNASGFPKYRYEYKNNSIINDLIKNDRDRDRLLTKLQKNHSRAMDMLEGFSIICMKQNLEIDLIASYKACDILYDHLQIDSQSRNQHELLVNRKKQIKKIENILYVIENIPHKNLPNSYKRIKKVMKTIAKTISNK